MKLKEEVFSILKAAKKTPNPEKKKKAWEVEKNKIILLEYTAYQPLPWLQPIYVMHIAVVCLYLWDYLIAGNKNI